MQLKLPRTLLERREAASGIVLICLLLSGVAEAASIGSLLPALSVIASEPGGSGSVLGHYVQTGLAAFDVSPSLGNIILLAVSLMAAKAILSFAALSYAGILAARVSVSLRRRLVAGFFDARWSYLASQKVGHVANALGNDAARAGDAYLVSAQVAAYAIQAMSYVVLNFLINWRIALFGLAGGLIVVLSLGRLVEVGRRAGYRQTDGTAQLSVLTADALASLKPIKSMWRQHAIQDRIGCAMSGVHRSLVAREVAKAGLVQGSDLLLAVLVGAGLYLGHAVGGLPLPALIISGIGFFQILSVVSRLQRYLQQAATLESAFLRTTALIGEVEANRELNSGRYDPVVPCSLRLENVSLCRRGNLVLDNVSLEIPDGQITVLQGHSGAGKTTIIDLILGLISPSEGRIVLGDLPLSDVDIWAWRRHVGYVPQELNLFHATVRENITLLDPTISDAEVWDALVLAGAAQLVRQLPAGLDTVVGEMGSKLSGGERQRISLARALVAQPTFLILDEVTSALDPVTETQVLANIVALRGRFTVFTISHRAAWAMAADRIYELQAGTCKLVGAANASLISVGEVFG